MPTESKQSPVRRSRLTPERERELYTAVLELLREVGYEALTMDAVAARTRSSKATLYRQWRGKPELVVSALRCSKPVRVAELDTGSLRGDLLGLVNCVCDHVEEDTALMRGLIHAAHTNPDLQRALQELVVQPEMDAFRAMLDRAVRRGEIDADAPALEFVLHNLLGMVLARPLIDERPADADYLSRYLHAVLFPVLGMD